MSVWHCNHLSPPGHGDPNTRRKMVPMAQRELRFVHCWAVVNPGNALVAQTDSSHGPLAVFERKADAEALRRRRASAYVVVRVLITPDYETPCRCDLCAGIHLDEKANRP